MRYISIIILFLFITIHLKADFQEKGTIILGRPTENSITMNILAKNYIEFYIEYGTSSGSFPNKTVTYSSAFPEPVEFVINNLEQDIRYYYRIQYRENQNQEFTESSEYFFHTQRAKGDSFSFTIQSDSHLYDKKGSSGLMKVTMLNQLKDSADFVLDLGDTFGDDHNPFDITNEEVKQLHLNFLSSMSTLTCSSPLFLCLGNHEGESGYYLLQTPPNNLAVYETKWRQKYYPNPYPDGFYSGNDDEEPYGIGMPENYYSFEWGDALFVILDVYRYYTANEKPKGWDWTIGDKQYFWFKNTLENSNAKYKFVFAHHVLGQGRGAVSDAILYEWGGWKDSKKTKWEFTDNRPGWDKPLHQLMVDNGVQIFFQGHDHLFAKEVLDGVVYQEVPMPSDSTYMIGMLANADAYTDLTLDGSGYLRVNVLDKEVKVDYVKSYLPKDETDSLKNGMITYSYEIKKSETIIKENIINDNKIGIQLYPNPGSEVIYLNLEFAESGIIEINVYDSYGREINKIYNGILCQGVHKFEFIGTGLSTGIYNLIIKTNSSIYLKNIILLK